MIFFDASPMLFFTVPLRDEYFAEQVSELCYEQLHETDPSSPNLRSRLEKELLCMRNTQSAIHFLILKTIKEASEAMGYPIMLGGAMSGSVIAWLLGISDIDLMTWKTELRFIWRARIGKPRRPDFDVWIAEEARDEIVRALDRELGKYPEDYTHDTHYRLAMPEMAACSKLGRLHKESGVMPPESINTDCDLLGRTLLAYLRKELAGGGEWGSAEQRKGIEALEKALSNRSEIDLNTAARIFGCTVGHTHGEIDLKSPTFYALRDELPHGSGTAYPGLWPKVACLERLRILTALQWYKECFVERSF